jgi:hypothetical protein
MKRHPDIAAALGKAIEPFVRDLAADLAVMLRDHVNDRLEDARTFAIEKLQADLEGTDHEKADEEAEADQDGRGIDREDLDEVDDEPAARPARKRAGRADRGDRDRREGGPKSPACSKCGAPGHNARSCGREPKGSRRQAIAARASVVAEPPQHARTASRSSRQQLPRAEQEPSSDDDEEGPGVELLVTSRRRRTREIRGLGARGVTIAANGRTWRSVAAEIAAEIEPGATIEFDLDDLRPRTRGECVHGVRPCPWVGCRYHMYLDVQEETGSLKIVFPDRDYDGLADTCALDVADRGEHTLDGGLLNVTRERARQLETRALRAVKLVTRRHGLAVDALAGFAHPEGDAL